MDYSSLVDFDKKNDLTKKDVKDTVKRVKKDTPKREETRKRSRSRSPKQKVKPMEEEFIDYNIPSRMFGDLYCVVCDSHMNSEQMWENHIIGKRHLKNSRKGDTTEQKYEYCSEEPTVQKDLDKESPIAGLDHICEILRVNQPPVYQCFLCSASLTTSKLLIEHIMGLKHRMAFLKEHDKEKYSLVDSSALSKSYLEPIVRDLILKYEQEHGRGKMSVKKEKGKPGSSVSYKKSNNADGDKHSLKSTKRSVPSKASRYSPPPKSSRYSPPKSSRYSPPKSDRYSPPRSSRYSPPPRSSRSKERLSETEWQKVPLIRERSREPFYSDRSYYSDEEKWPRIESDSTSYRREALTYSEIHDSRVDSANNYSRTWPSVDEGRNFSDLRAVLEHKKSLGMTSSAAKANMDVVSSKITTISDNLISLVNDMSPEVFLSLAVFKLGDMDVKEERELNLLDRIAEKAAALALDVRKKFISPDLKAKFQEALAQNGLSSQNKGILKTSQSNLQFTQNLEDFIGHFKARKATPYEDVLSQGTYSSNLKSTEQFIDNKSVSHLHLNTSPSYQKAPEITSHDSGWNQRQTSSLPFQSFSSTPSYIPGLTLTEESPSQPSPTLSQLAQTAQQVFGNITVPSTSANLFQNEDYNRLNYRY